MFYVYKNAIKVLKKRDVYDLINQSEISTRIVIVNHWIELTMSTFPINQNRESTKFD